MTESVLHDERVGHERRPRVGYAMAVAAAGLFAVNGTVSKVILTGGGLTTLRLTELRATGAFLALVAFLLLTRPNRLRVRRDEVPLLLLYGVVGFALVQWLYFVAIERLPIGIGLLLEFTAPVLVALWARLVWHEAVRRRVWVALALALAGLALVAEVWQDVRLDAVGVAAGLVAAGGLAMYFLVGEHATERRDPVSLLCLALGVAAGFWAIVQPWWGFPFDALAESVALQAPFECARSGLGALPLDDRPGNHRPVRSLHRRSPAPPGDSRLDRGDARGGARVDRRVGLARRDALDGPAARRRRRAGRRRAGADVALSTLGVVAVERVLLACPRGYCAGVERAVETVEKALEHYGAPVYVRKQIVHNIHVVRDLEARGAIFVEDERDVPPGATVVYSAHGVAPSVHANSKELRHDVIDATCPLVTKVHVQARRYAAAGYTVLLIGHAGHEEVVGTMGEAPDATILVQDVAEAEALELPPETPVAYVTQTTLSVDETAEIIGALRRRFPAIVGPKKEDICYATSNRQWAVKDMLAEIDLLLVIGSRNSSNSNRLVDVARASEVPSHLIDDETEIDERWLDGVRTVGITSGASAPERLVERVCDWFRARGVERIEPYSMVDEDVTFRLPVELRRELALAERASG